ncbi:Myosin regulatory light chain 1 [Cladobotryum mycophilum]|uniref:Myosin regulatory light chain 1 n=1 Tax=Cladobotryum mycophilum TaxID=491253 RepID=A0ABR0SDK7_9HYPO
MSVSTAYKPSPLGYGSPPAARSSPFRRPDAVGSPLRFERPTTPTSPDTPTQQEEKPEPEPEAKMVTSPHRPSSSGWGVSSKSLGSVNALSQLQPAQVRTLRDGFQILDRDCDGIVNREDVADMLNQLGLPSGPLEVGQFFPPSKPQTISLAAFLNSLAESLAILSPSSELMSAFSAFDDDDSGQVDWAELKDALLHTPPEAGQPTLSAAQVDKVVEGFTGRRAFNRNMNAHLAAKRGEVFKYQEFVNSIMGANGGSEGLHIKAPRITNTVPSF